MTFLTFAQRGCVESGIGTAKEYKRYKQIHSGLNMKRNGLSHYGCLKSVCLSKNNIELVGFLTVFGF